MISVEEQMKIIAKGAKEIVGEEDLRNKLKRAVEQNKGLTIKLGLDPSAPDIHLGHSVVLRKIRQMQDMGHKAVIVIGDFTGRIGDPTGKSKGRTALSEEEVKENARTYTEQIFEIMDREKTEVVFNSSWLKELNFEEVIRLASSVTVARILERDDFTERYRNNIPIGLHEFFYPLMQAYDSVALNADIEIGGTDQTFNILMGRSLLKWMGKEPQAAIFLPILEGLDGVEKMSKSLGNYIGIHEDASVMFKKVMEVPDDLIIRYFELVTDEHPDRIAALQEELEKGANPRDIKYELARVITTLYHRDKAAEAENYYLEAFHRKGIPDSIPELTIELDKDTLAGVIPILVQEKYVQSGSEFRRLLSQGGISINGEILTTQELDRVLICQDVLKIGKKKFLRIIK
ncbi:tyrosine--tRNA ligase [Anaerocolumna sp. AGMB13020]|uniref:tyrosine--tRNA ligase n=1 Tax=Anaerocolumna sp. AGMB13020 TaxID=3081750 RepID=UPI002955B802|nr:tyrosine--tRNA ligase [Anaerocolumna sp. AGMB13020]WOO36344.1 tyrosine--tRNA ligase [Anaerocolumna sp. AGMB13020]